MVVNCRLPSRKIITPIPVTIQYNTYAKGFCDVFVNGVEYNDNNRTFEIEAHSGDKILMQVVTNGTMSGYYIMIDNEYVLQPSGYNTGGEYEWTVPSGLSSILIQCVRGNPSGSNYAGRITVTTT